MGNLLLCTFPVKKFLIYRVWILRQRKLVMKRAYFKMYESYISNKAILINLLKYVIFFHH